MWAIGGELPFCRLAQAELQSILLPGKLRKCVPSLIFLILSVDRLADRGSYTVSCSYMGHYLLQGFKGFKPLSVAILFGENLRAHLI